METQRRLKGLGERSLECPIILAIGLRVGSQLGVTAAGDSKSQAVVVVAVQVSRSVAQSML